MIEESGPINSYELRDQMVDMIQREGTDAEVVVMLRRKWGHQKRMRLANVKGAPYGEPLMERRGSVAVSFRAQDILDWLEQVPPKPKEG